MKSFCPHCPPTTSNKGPTKVLGKKIENKLEHKLPNICIQSVAITKDISVHSHFLRGILEDVANQSNYHKMKHVNYNHRF